MSRAIINHARGGDIQVGRKALRPYILNSCYGYCFGQRIPSGKAAQCFLEILEVQVEM